MRGTDIAWLTTMTPEFYQDWVSAYYDDMGFHERRRFMQERLGWSRGKARAASSVIDNEDAGWPDSYFLTHRATSPTIDLQAIWDIITYHKRTAQRIKGLTALERAVAGALLAAVEPTGRESLSHNERMRARYHLGTKVVDQLNKWSERRDGRYSPEQEAFFIGLVGHERNVSAPWMAEAIIDLYQRGKAGMLYTDTIIFGE